MLALAVLVTSYALALQDPPITNGGFESGGERVVAGWTLAMKGKSDDDLIGSQLMIDRGTARSGEGSLLLASPRLRVVEKKVTQVVETRPGGIYKLRGFYRSLQLARDVLRSQDVWIALVFYDDRGRERARKIRRPAYHVPDWKVIGVSARAPEEARRTEIEIFASMSGTLWVDDLELFIDGGRKLKTADVLLQEGFEGGDAALEAWRQDLRRSLSDEPVRSKITVDPSGTPASPGSVKLQGTIDCAQWHALSRDVRVRPGDDLWLQAWVKAAEVRSEGSQRPTLQIDLTFFDQKDAPLGPPELVHPGAGTYDWKAVDIHCVAPPRAALARVGLFLSMSGEAWFDEVRLTRRGRIGDGSGWETTETANLKVRYPLDHPRARGMKAYARDLERTYRRVRDALELKRNETITVHLYRDAAHGREVTGRTLDFADPEKHAVHLGPDARPGRELALVLLGGLGAPGRKLLAHGIALFLDGRGADFHHGRAAHLLETDRLPPLDTVLRHYDDDVKLSSRAAASFCGYVLATFGPAKYKELYALSAPRRNAKRVLGEHLERVWLAWRGFLRERK